MGCIGQIGWHIGRGAAEFNTPAHMTNIFHIEKNHVSKDYLVSRSKTLEVSYYERT